MNKDFPEAPFDSNASNVENEGSARSQRIGNKTLAVIISAGCGAVFVEAANGWADFVTGHEAFKYSSPKEQVIALAIGTTSGLVAFGRLAYRDLPKQDAAKNSNPPQA